MKKTNWMKTLTDISLECGDLLVKERKKGLKVFDKEDTKGVHFTTSGDEASHERAIKRIRQADKDIPIIAEEQKNPSKVPAKCILVDDCDGTNNYSSGNSDFGFTACLLEKGRPKCGVIYLPNRQTLLTVERGRGCFINDKKVKIKFTRPLDKTVINVDFGPWAVSKIVKPLYQQFTVRSTLCAVSEAVEVLRGHSGGYLNYNVAKIWDIAVGALATKEAGGIATDLSGKQLKWNKIPMDWIITPNRQMHQQFIKHTKNWKNQR